VLLLVDLLIYWVTEAVWGILIVFGVLGPINRSSRSDTFINYDVIKINKRSLYIYKEVNTWPFSLVCSSFSRASRLVFFIFSFLLFLSLLAEIADCATLRIACEAFKVINFCPFCSCRSAFLSLVVIIPLQISGFTCLISKLQFSCFEVLFSLESYFFFGEATFF